MLFLVATMMVAMLPAMAYDFMAGGLCYDVNEDGESVTVTYQNTESPRYTDLSGALTIPTTVSHDGTTYRVTAIKADAFNGTGITEVTVPATITQVGSNAFSKCPDLKTVNWNVITCKGYASNTTPFLNSTGITTFKFGNSVKEIPAYLCYKQESITQITIPNSVTVINNSAIRECTSLSQVTLGNSVKQIGYACFAQCASLKKVTLPNSLVTLEGNVFSGCTGLEQIDMGNSVTEMGVYVFAKCTALTQITIPASVTKIGEDAFYECTGLTKVNTPDLTAWCNIDFSYDTSNPVIYAKNLYVNGTKLTSVTIPSTITNVKPYTFYSCEDLTSVTIPSTVKTIGRAAFAKCTGLTQVVVPNSVTELGDYAFWKSTNLTTVSLSNKLATIGKYAFSGCSGLKQIDIPNSLNTISDKAFYGCSQLSTINIPNSVSYIGAEAFAGTPWFSNQASGVVYAGMVAYTYKGTMPVGTSITLKNGCTGIASYAFYEQSRLKSITMPNSVKAIGYAAFAHDTTLTQITIPPSLKMVAGHAFYQCTGLTKVNISDLAAWCDIDYDNEFGNPLYIGHDLYLNGNKVTNLTIPSTVTNIKKYAFLGDTIMSQVTIPASVTAIGSDAFKECKGVTRVNTPDINAWLRIDFGNSYANPISYARSLHVNGAKLTSLVLPATLTHVKDFTFYGCESLVSLTLPASLVSTGYSSFAYCTGLTELQIPQSMTTIGPWSFAYTGITTAHIPTSVTTLNHHAFANCGALTSAYIPATVTTLGDGIFRNCTSLSNVVTRIADPRNVDYEYSSSPWHFYRIPRTSTLYVPKGTLDLYQAPWNGYRNPWRFSVSGYTFGAMKEFVDGDVNNDLEVTSSDIACVVNVLATLPDAEQYQFRADVNEDGEVTAADVSMVVNILAGL